MSVRSGILAVLSLGPAYGLQLHTELETRTARTGRINVGQIYSTLTRLTGAGLVAPLERQEPAELPRYELSAAGRSEAAAWLVGERDLASDWGGMVEHVLLAASLPGADLTALLTIYRSHWTEVGAASMSHADDLEAHRLAALADHLLAAGALAWLDRVQESVSSGRFPTRALSLERPRRGRKPSLAT